MNALGGQTDGEKTAAVILTHNNAAAALQRCEELSSQSRPPAVVLVVDNASTDGTAERIAQRFPHVQVLSLAENRGPAGGFGAGFRRARDLGCDFIWAIEDDVVLSPTCLEHLLHAAAASPGKAVFPTRLPRTKNLGWHGLLLPVAVLDQVGFPREDLFWWGEDTEFVRRIQRGGFGPVKSLTAVVWHYTRRPRRGYPAWRLYYETRNPVYYAVHVTTDPRERLKVLARVLARVLRVSILEERGRAKAWLMLRGVRDGWRHRLGKTVDPRDQP